MPDKIDDVIMENLYAEAQEKEDEGYFEDALALYKEGYEMSQSEKFQTAIKRTIDKQGSQIAESFQRNLLLRNRSQLQSTPHNRRDNDQSYLNQTSSMLADGDRSFNTTQYNQLIVDARTLYKESSDPEEALKKYKQAYTMHQDSKLLKRIQKIDREITHYNSNQQGKKCQTEDDIEQYNILVIDAKSCIELGNKREALSLYHQAYTIDSSDKLKKKIDVLSAEIETEEGDGVDDQDKRENADKDEDEEQQIYAERFNNLIRSAKAKLSEENYEEALSLYKEAYEMNPSDKLQKRIHKIADFLQDHSEEDSNDEEHVPSNDQELNKSLATNDTKALCNEIVARAKQFEEQKNYWDAIDAYREAQILQPCPHFVAQIRELEQKIAVNEKQEDQETESDLDVELYNNLILQGREYLDDGNLESALKSYKDAHKLNPSEKLKKRINKIENKCQSNKGKETNNSEEEEEVDEEVREYYEATIDDAKTKADKLLYDEAIALYEEANELIPSDKLANKIARLEFQRDSEKENATKPNKTSSVQSLNDLSSVDKLKYNEYITKGKFAQKECKIEKALSYFNKAANIYKPEKLGTRITKLETFLEDENENEALYTDIGDGFFLTNEVHDKLYDYQREGVKWMWELYRAGHGGILGDDMGLGKTIQTITFLQAMFFMEEISSAMLVMPLSLVNNWQEEFKKWAPEVRVELFHGSKAERERNVKKVIRKGGVIFTTYGIIEKNVEYLANTNFKWDYLILDEGHKIKNPTKTSKAMRNVPCSNRLLISGTPIQNNLKELWALFDFVSRGKLLGTMTTFKMNYITPIERGREKDASNGEARLGAKLAENLRKLIDPYFLRRTKDEIKKRENGGRSTGISELGSKNELCVWLQLSDGQHDLYKAFLTLDSVRDAMNSSKSPLAALTVLKKICDHPRLAIKFEALKEVMDAENMNMRTEDHKKLLKTVELPPNPTDEMLQNESCKLKFALSLLEFLSNSGHRTLLFSTSLKILNYIQTMITCMGLKCCRIDGTINKPGDRTAIIEMFNTDHSYSVFLLTTQVGGVGLNLTSADRVVIYDPNWNPATDSQAVDRAYRIGQTKPVIVYRLLTCGTIEEKIYRKQVFKDSITRQATGDSLDPIRYFTNQEISSLFLLESTSFSETCNQLEELHGAARNHPDQLKYELGEIKKMGSSVIDCSDHDLLFSHEEVVENTPEEKRFVEDRVEQAKRILRLETDPNSGPAPTFPGRLGHVPAFPGRIPPPDPRNLVALSSTDRAPWESARNYNVWNNPTNTVEQVTGQIQDVRIEESPYFNPPVRSPMTDLLREAEVIVIDDEEEEEDDEVKEVKKKLSLSDYKKRQMKIFDYMDSPTGSKTRAPPQPRRSIRPDPPKTTQPEPISPVRPKNVVTKPVRTPRKSLSNPVGLIINNHVQNTPKKVGYSSDDEVQEDLETSRYDNLNKPACLDESDEEDEDEEEEGKPVEEEQEEEDGEEEEEQEQENESVAKPKEETSGVLSNMMNKVNFNEPSSDVTTPNFRALSTNKTIKSPEEQDMAGPVQTPDLSKISGNKGKENTRPKVQAALTDCTCGRAQTAIDKGYKVTKCVCMCTQPEEEKYNKYLKRGLEHHKNGNGPKALQYYRAALQLRNDDTTVQKAYMSLKKQVKPQ